MTETRGLLKRAFIEATGIIPVGKETDRRWELGDDMSLFDFRVLEYQQPERMLVADQVVIDRIVELGMRETIRRTGLSQHTIAVIRRKQSVRRATLERLRKAFAE